MKLSLRLSLFGIAILILGNTFTQIQNDLSNIGYWVSLFGVLISLIALCIKK